ncbi:MAG: LysM peptidoglycan-binding domain-containing protein [Clostridia bacterium]|nr:LysM peptidoglycan-binding domain-containing protein [Clostridia bacterium]
MDTTRSYNEITDTSFDINHIIYTIKRGDTLSQIAKEFNVTIESIAKLNDIKDINLIYAGDRLRIEG